MAKEFAFLFYPGEYLRDTQCLSEQSQVAYDRILCEHMRNICISKTQLNFFTKKLSPEQLEELKMVLTEQNGCFSIHWVVDSINKRKGFVESRRSNRTSKPKEHMNNISKSYDEHKVIVNEIVIVKEEVIGKGGTGERDGVVIYGGDALIKELLNSEWLETIEIQFKLNQGDGILRLQDFAMELKIKNKYGRALGQIKEHFFNWLNIKITKNGTTKFTGNDRAQRAESVDNMEDLALKVLRGSEPDHG